MADLWVSTLVSYQQLSAAAFCLLVDLTCTCLLFVCRLLFCFILGFFAVHWLEPQSPVITFILLYYYSHNSLSHWNRCEDINKYSLFSSQCILSSACSFICACMMMWTFIPSNSASFIYLQIHVLMCVLYVCAFVLFCLDIRDHLI